MMDLVHIPPRSFVTQLVAKNYFPGNKNFEKAFRRELLHRIGQRLRGLEVNDRAFYGGLHESADYHPRRRALRQRMHPQPAMRVGLMIAQKGVELIKRYNHERKITVTAPDAASSRNMTRTS